jgi:hypothetical protein
VVVTIPFEGNSVGGRVATEPHYSIYDNEKLNETEIVLELNRKKHFRNFF